MIYIICFIFLQYNCYILYIYIYMDYIVYEAMFDCESPGNPEGQKWMLTKYLGKGLHYATPLTSSKQYKRFLKQHPVAIVGHFKREGDKEHQVFLEAMWRLQRELPMAVAVAFPKASELVAPTISIHSQGAVEEMKPEAWSVQALLATRWREEL